MVYAKIITVGDELLLGQVADVNSSAIARELSAIGVEVAEFQSVHDKPSTICETVLKAIREYDVVITTGGLGPTKDDLTKTALASLFGSGLEGAAAWKTSPEQLEVIKELLSSKGIGTLPENLAQAQVPACAEVIVNRKGTAPIMVFRGDNLAVGGAAGHRLYCMSGVPFETRAALVDVIADIRGHFPVAVNMQHRYVMTHGIAESALSHRIASWEAALPTGMHLAYLPNPVLGIRLRLDYLCEDELADEQIEKLCALIPDNVYALEDTSLQEVVVKKLSQERSTLAVAESVTGGNISHLLTLVPGCSSILKGTVTSYTNEAKTDVLGVPAEIITAHTEVSRECAVAMALGVKHLMDADYALATTGFSEPWAGADNGATGSTVAESSNPLAWVAVALPSGEVRTTLLSSNSIRGVNIDRFSAGALFFLLKNL